MEKNTTKVSATVRLARAGIVAALYAALTMIFGALAYGPLQIRPAEALCILPIFFPEAIPGLFVGCMLANLLSGYGVYDIVFGSLITLVAAFSTWAIGKALKGNLLSAILGGLPPVLFNAIGIPFIIILASPGESFAAYWVYFAQLLLTETIWVYVLGIPLYYAVRRMKNHGVKFMM